MSYYTTTSGQETLRDQPIFFFLYKAAVITSTPARPSLFFPLWDQNTKGISYLLCWIGARNRNFSRPPTSLLPPPFFLFANDVEIWNHFVFSVIMNIWCMPSGHVVVWWAWPWLLVKKKKKKRHKCTSWFRLSYFFARLVMYKHFKAQWVELLNEWILLVLLLVWTLKKKKNPSCLFGSRNKWGGALMCCWLEDPRRYIFWDNTSPYISTEATLYSHSVGSGHRDDDTGEKGKGEMRWLGT